MIQVQNIVQDIQGRRVLDGITCHFRAGRLYGIIGPNGVGKSTLLHLLSGVEKPKHGDIILDRQSVWAYPRKQLARKLAVLQQGGLPPAGFSVREVVGMGRYPYQSWLGGESGDSEAIIDAALESMGLKQLAERKLDQLSGGERQRVALAKLMAQQPSILLLDEPTTYLDIGYQVQLLDTVRAWQRERGLTVIAVLHDLNLAALYCEELIVLHQGQIAAAGTPAEVLNAELISHVYGTAAAVIAHPLTGAPQIMLNPGGSE
jgi:iron complex transport system ATP-binding protein